MRHVLSGIHIAVLAASGFHEQDFLQIQKVIKGTGALIRLISPDNGVISGINDGSWGHNHAVDAPLNTALGVDYGALILPGGNSSLAKLKATAHTKRFIGSFLDAEKPVIALGNSVELLEHTGQMGAAVMAVSELASQPLDAVMEYLASGARMEQEAA